jgi:hypothetical protein
VLAGLLVEVHDTSLGSDVTLYGDDFSTHPGLLDGCVELIGSGFQHVLSSTVDDDLSSASGSKGGDVRTYFGTVDSEGSSECFS